MATSKVLCWLLFHSTLSLSFVCLFVSHSIFYFSYRSTLDSLLSSCIDSFSCVLLSAPSLSLNLVLFFSFTSSLLFAIRFVQTIILYSTPFYSIFDAPLRWCFSLFFFPFHSPYLHRLSLHCKNEKRNQWESIRCLVASTRQLGKNPYARFL